MSDQENDERQRSMTDKPGEVGYRRPPMRRQFKVSGNPKGRPKGAKNRKTIVQEVADETHSVIESGKRRKRSTLELALLRLRSLALEDKNVRAFGELHKLIEAYQPQETRDDVGYLVVPAELTPEEYIAMIKKVNHEIELRGPRHRSAGRNRTRSETQK